MNSAGMASTGYRASPIHTSMCGLADRHPATTIATCPVHGYGREDEMAIDTTAPRSRRALLTAGIGALGALAATAIGRPDPVAAATDTTAVHKGVNNPTSAETRIT